MGSHNQNVEKIMFVTKQNYPYFILISGLFLYCCGIDGRGASNPNQTATEFAHPTGLLLSKNIDDIVISGVYNVDSIRYREPETLFPDADFENCKFSGDPDSTIDWECAYRNIDGCTAHGETILTDNSDHDFTQVDYKDFSIECSGTITVPPQSVDGQINTSRTDSTIFCAHFERSEGDLDKNSNACKNSSGETSVRFENDTYVIGAYILDPSCTNLSTTITDKEKTQTVTCDITKFVAPCTALSNIQEIDNCKIL